MDGIQAIGFVAKRLGPLLDRMTFLGGATVGLLVTDSGGAPPRPTKDVDVIVEATSWLDYARLRGPLVSLGFRESSDEQVICRWTLEDVKVDIMPTDGTILGFRNQWYKAAVAEAAEYPHPDGPTIRLISPACFLATKLDAFEDRGRGDYQASADIDDIVSVIDGRPSIVADVRTASRDVRAYLAHEFTRHMTNTAFVDALAGQLPPDPASQQRLPIVVNRIADITLIK